MLTSKRRNADIKRFKLNTRNDRLWFEQVAMGKKWLGARNPGLHCFSLRPLFEQEVKVRSHLLQHNEKTQSVVVFLFIFGCLRILEDSMTQVMAGAGGYGGWMKWSQGMGLSSQQQASLQQAGNKFFQAVDAARSQAERSFTQGTEWTLITTWDFDWWLLCQIANRWLLRGSGYLVTGYM